MRSQCVTLGKGLSPACDNLLHLRCFRAAESAYSREEQKDTGMEPILLIDDDVELCSMLSDYLGRQDVYKRQLEGSANLGQNPASPIALAIARFPGAFRRNCIYGHSVVRSVVDSVLPVSYTHLDVYKRQGRYLGGNVFSFESI